VTLDVKTMNQTSASRIRSLEAALFKPEAISAETLAGNEAFQEKTSGGQG
jgi:hypothetical protein